MQDTMFQQQVNPPKQHALQEPIKWNLAETIVMMQSQDTTFQQQDNQAKLLVQQEHIRWIPDRILVMLQV